jgi:hypothetical protein
MKTKTLLSFHGKKSIKAKYLARVKAHVKADEIIKGTYWQNGKGCAVGCTLHSDKHDAYEPELGITWRLALVEDYLFEKLPNGEAKKFPVQFLELMPVGVDTNLIFKNFVLWNLADKKEGLIYHLKDKKQIEALTEIADTYKKSFKEEIPQERWKELSDKYASSSAYSSASAAASASASTYASAYAYAYAYAYASASAPAAASTYVSAYAYAYAYASAYASEEWQQKFDERIFRMRDKLLQLIKTAK